MKVSELSGHQIIRACPCCGKFKNVPICVNHLEPINFLDMSYEVGQCIACGFIYAFKLPGLDSYSRYYHQLSKYDFSGSLGSVTEQLRASVAVEICSSVLNYEDKIADIGCGAGYLLSCFNREGYTALYGIDPSPAAPDCAKRLYQLECVSTGSLENVSTLLPIAEIKLVAMTGVLEHLWSLRKSLVELVNSMSTGSFILVEVPALESFDALNDEPFGEFSLEHIQFFSVTSLSNFMASIGLQCIDFKIITLPAGSTDSIFGLYEVNHNNANIQLQRPEFDMSRINTYVETSRHRHDDALRHLPQESFILYGAGSHSARLLQALSPEQRRKIIAVVDKNPNLKGKCIGPWLIEDPEVISELPLLPVVVSSCRSQGQIADALQSRYNNKVISLY